MPTPSPPAASGRCARACETLAVGCAEQALVLGACSKTIPSSNTCIRNANYISPQDGDGREVLHVGSMRLVEKEGRSHQPCYLTLLSDRLEVAAGSKGGRPFMTVLVSSMESVSLSNRTRPPPGEDGPYDYDDPPDDEDGVDHDNDSTSDDPPQSMFIVLDDGRVLQFTNSSVSDVEVRVGGCVCVQTQKTIC